MPEAAEIQAPPAHGGPGGTPTPSAPVRRWARAGTAALLAVTPLVAALLPSQAVAVETSVSTPATSAHTADPAGSTGTTDAARTAESADAPASAARSASTASTAAPGGAKTANVSLNNVTPAAPGPDDTLTVTGTVTNKSSSATKRGRMALRVGPRVSGRSALEDAAKRDEFVPGAEGEELSRKHSVKVPGMRPGASREFELKVPVSALKLGESGVYQLSVTLNGKTGDRPYEQVLGFERSFLPWQKSSSSKKTNFTYLWPLISTSHLTARTESDEQQTPVFRDDKLAKQIAPGGRLHQMVSMGKDLPVTWVIDPDLLAAVDMMTKPYQVREEDGGTTEGTGQDHAKAWLNDLQEAVEESEVVALPFADPDLASLAHRGQKVRDALSHLGPATELASVTVETVLETRATTEFAWPVEGAIDSSIVDVSTSAGAHNVITRGDSLRDDNVPYTPTSARPIGGGNIAVAADAPLSKAFDSDLARAGRSPLAVQRFLAQTQLINAQNPGSKRSIVVAPQRMPTTSQAKAMATAVRELDTNGRWAQQVDLTKAAKAKPDPRANRNVPSGGSYPGSLRKDELSTKAFEQVRKTRSTLDDFKVILSRDDRVVTPFGTAIYRALSTSWRDSPHSAKEYRESVQDYLVGLTKKVRLIKKSDITLSGRSATIPVTVQNNLVQRVDGLELRLTSSRRIGMDVGGPQPVAVDGGHSQSVKFDTSAKANGRATVVAQLYTKDGEPYGQPMEFHVKVTSITSTVLLVIAGGVLLVVLAGIRMYTQRRRRAAAPEAEASATPTGNADAGTAGERGTSAAAETGGAPERESEQPQDEQPGEHTDENRPDGEPQPGTDSAPDRDDDSPGQDGSPGNGR